MPSQIIGRVQPINQGNYDATRAYVVLDRVKYQDAWYECQADAAAGVAPEEGGNAYWMEIGGRGADGLTPSPVWSGTELHFEYSDGTSTSAVDLQGPQGVQGVQGPPGQTPPLTSDLTSTAPDVALSALGGKMLKDLYDDVNGAVVPVGSIIWSANASVPAGYLLCNGASVGRDTYPELFAAIGTTYGEGDGSTTFNLPNMIGRFIEGAATAGTVKAAGLPAMTGGVVVGSFAISGDAPEAFAAASGCLSTSNVTGAHRSLQPTAEAVYTKTWSGAVLHVDASRSSSIYGNSTTVQPPSVTALPCIKAFSAVVGDATVVAGQLVNEIQSKVALDGSNVSSIGSTLSEYMAHAAMPSGQYIDLTLPASGGTVTAPADGWIYLRKATNPNGLQDVFLGSNYVGVYNINTLTYSGVIALSIPVKKGAVVTVAYNATHYCPGKANGNRLFS